VQAEAATAQAEQAVTGMQETILAVLHARGIPCPEDVRSRLMSCNDFPTLQSWLLRATAVGTAAEVFEVEARAPRE
jgi:hypothetical protein